ncbi:MAG: tetratricopeptide repeat protein [Myxococcales bacterium]|nr:tetratricopeptide repeat protein [Myxococcales bacterium]
MRKSHSIGWASGLLAGCLSFGGAWAAPGGDGARAVEALDVAREAARWRLAGDRLLSAGEPAKAEAAWSRALVARPDDVELLDRAARARSALGDWAGALAAQRSLVAALAGEAAARPDAKRVDLATGFEQTLADNHRRQLGVLSEVAVLAGDFTTAEEAARALIRVAPKAVDGHLALGYLHLHAREFDAAAAAYAAALALDPSNPTALNNLGAARYMQQDLDAAAAHYEAVLASLARGAYSESVALANLGELHQLGARYDEAEYLYRQAVEALPAGAWSYMGLAALLDVTGRYDEAIDAMIDGWERDDSRETRLNMHFFEPAWAWQRDALIAEIEGDVEGGIRLWRKVAHSGVPALRAAAAHHLVSLEAMGD